MKDIKPGDYVNITLRIKVKSIEHIERPLGGPDSPNSNPFTAITYVSGASQMKDKDGWYLPPRPDEFTLELANKPVDSMEFTITKENA